MHKIKKQTKQKRRVKILLIFVFLIPFVVHSNTVDLKLKVRRRMYLFHLKKKMEIQIITFFYSSLNNKIQFLSRYIENNGIDKIIVFMHVKTTFKWCLAYERFSTLVLNKHSRLLNEKVKNFLE